MNELYYRYWGKAKKDQPDYHLLVYHSLDVAAVGQVLLDRHDSLKRRLSDSLNLSEEAFQKWMLFFLAIHDIGKFAEAFQGLRRDLLKRLLQKEKPRPYHVRHDSLGYILWRESEKKFEKDGIYSEKLDGWMQAVCGHHGKPPILSDGNRRILAKDSFSKNDVEAAYQFIKDMSRLFLSNAALPQDKSFSKQLRNISWWLAGFCVLCDWIGSGHYKYCQHPVDLSEYWQKAVKNADKAVNESGVIPAKKASYSGIRSYVEKKDKPSPLQEFCHEQELTAQPQLWILEDVTGSGKTEAALILAHRLMSLEQADGVFIGLPTMATANSIYDRMAKHYRKLYADDQKPPSLILAHSARHLYLSEKFSQSILPHLGQDQDYQQDEHSALSQCSAWIADHRKKSMLADVSIGTIDQAMLGVLPVRHQSLRLLGLMSKVLIVDEIHAYDDYMRPIICALIKFHTRIKGSIILLSATLPENIRRELVKAYREGLGNYEDFVLEKKKSYPLVTSACGHEVKEFPIETRKELERSVSVKLIHNEDSVYDIILKAAEAGQCVCWIRNSVTDARESFQRLKEMNADKISLFHARFALYDRLKIEKNVTDTFGKDSDQQNQQKRQGKILIATQVVEQSLDLDFDVLISDLAPIDLIIQRAGRLHRHSRDYRKSDPVCYVLSPEPVPDPPENWFSSFFPRSKKIYPDVGKLWLTARLLSQKGCIKTPDGARALIEGIYGYDAEPIPEKLERPSYAAEGEQMAKKDTGRHNALKVDKGYSQQDAAWDEDANFPTRLGEDTVTVYLTDEQLNPLFNKGEYPWGLSSVKIYRFHLSDVSSDISKALKSKLKRLRETEKRLQAESIVLPMTQISENEWRADGVDGKGREVRVVYHSELGLFTEKEE